jgi:hypothetical protein
MSVSRFVVFREFDFGQEYGVAYVNAKKEKKLRSLFRVEVTDNFPSAHE